MIFYGLVRFFYQSLQETQFVYKRSNVIFHFLILAGECVTLTSIYEFLMSKNLKIVATIYTRVLLVLQFFYFGMSLFDLLFQYALMMRCAADIPAGYQIMKQPILFNDTLPVEGLPKLNIEKEFALHVYHGQRTQSHYCAAWVGFVIICHIVRLVQHIKQKNEKVQRPLVKRTKAQKIAMTSISITTIVTFLCYLFMFNADKFSEVAPVHWFYYRSTIRHQMPKDQYLKAVKDVRSKYTLPEGEDWIDQREVPMFPLVHGRKEIADAYN